MEEGLWHLQTALKGTQLAIESLRREMVDADNAGDYHKVRLWEDHANDLGALAKDLHKRIVYMTYMIEFLKVRGR